MTYQPKKRMGQHFLTDIDAINLIVRAIDAKPNQTVVEIGPGLGALTHRLAPSCKVFHAVELDRDLIPSLEQKFSSIPHFKLHHADALKLDYLQACYADSPLKIVGNLPYNISTPLLFHLMQFNDFVENYTFMLQKEVVERMCAKPGSKDYGRLSIMLQIYCDTTWLFDIPPEAFSPPPQVDSAIIRLTPHNRYTYKIQNFKLFSNIVLNAFNQRRKMLKNSLKDHLKALQSQKAIELLTLRPEAISIEQYIYLTNEISNHVL